MKKGFFLFLVVSSLWSYDVSVFEKEYKESFWTQPKKLEKTRLYKEAVSYLEDEKKYETDSIESKKFGHKSFKMPNFLKAYALFLESAKKENNLASMFMALKIRKKIYLNIKTKQDGERMKKKEGEIINALGKKLMNNNNCYGALVFYSNNKKAVKKATIDKLLGKCNIQHYGTALKNLQITAEKENGAFKIKK